MKKKMKTNKVKGDKMLEKLYENDPYKKSFEAKVLSVSNNDDKFYVKLDKTYFYPEGGGQPGDRGFIDGKEITDVFKKDNEVIHVLDQNIQEEKTVVCEIDWKRRYDLMQQHTGQHLLSAVLKNDYNLNTVGFTLSENTLRIDLDKKISKEKLNKVEYKVNSLIQKGIKIETTYPDKEELISLNLRKDPTVNKNIRVIKINGIDNSPCGGTHLNNTSELGMIKITDVTNYKGGLRVDFVCGNRALDDYNKKNNTILKLKDILSTPEDTIINEVINLMDRLDDYKNIANELNEKLLKYIAKDLINEATKIGNIKVITNIYNNFSYSNVQYLSDIICENNNNIVIFGQHDNSSARLLLAKSNNIDKLQMNEIINEPLQLINGSGGGTIDKAQGGGDYINNLDTAVERSFEIIMSKLK